MAVRLAHLAAKVAFIGHSQGTAVMFALLSNTDQYNDIVEHFIGIAPITRIGDAKTLLRVLTATTRPILKYGIANVDKRVPLFD